MKFIFNFNVFDQITRYTIIF